MLKTLIVAAVSFALILCIGLFCGYYSMNSSRQMREMVFEIEEKITDEDWQSAERKTEELEQHWEKKGSVLQFWVVHGDTDEISAGLGRLKAAIENKDKTLGAVYCRELIQDIDHLYKRDATNLKNIF